MLRNKVAVTGGAGFIGSHLVDKLVSMGNEVVVIDDLSSGNVGNLSVEHEFWGLSVTDTHWIKQALLGCSTVFHLASLVSVPESFERPKEFKDIIVEGTRTVVEVSPEGCDVILASSCAVYGDNDCYPEPISVSAETNPKSPYASFKLEAEGLVRKSLRFFNVYGSRQSADSTYSGIVAKCLDWKKKGETPIVCGDGEQSRDFVSVHDVVDALVKSSQVDFEGPLNVGSGKSTTINEIIWSFFGDVDVISKPARDEIRHIVADIKKTRDVLGFSPKHDCKQMVENVL